MYSEYNKEKEYYNLKNSRLNSSKTKNEMDNNGCEGQNLQNKKKNTKECGFINVTDPNLRNEIIKYTKCPSDSTNFTFWYSKADPENNWGITIKSVPKKSLPTENEKKHGMTFSSQHVWKITWYNDNRKLRIAQNSKSLADDILSDEFLKLEKIYKLYQGH